MLKAETFVIYLFIGHTFLRTNCYLRSKQCFSVIYATTQTGLKTVCGVLPLDAFATVRTPE